jgi:hypothetical protein
MLDASPFHSMVGITCGFVAGLSLIYGVDHFVSSFEQNENTSPHSSFNSSIKIKTHPKVIQPEGNTTSESTINVLRRRGRSSDTDCGEWHAAPVERASQAIAAPTHKQHIQEHLFELSDSISLMESQSLGLLGTSLSVREGEEVAERIDEEIHRLHYKLDHCRR